MQTIEEAIEQVNLVENGLQEQEIRIADLQVNRNGITIDGQSIELSDAGMHRLCQQIKIPAEYVSSLPRSVSSPVLQHHLSSNTVEKTLITRDGAFVAFTRSDLARLTGSQVVEAAVEAVAKKSPGLQIDGLSISNETLQFNILSEATTREVRAGDVIRAGLRVEHSLTGESATTVQSFMLRLLCMNGMTHNECGEKRALRTRRLSSNHSNRTELQIAQIRRLAEGTWSQLDKKLQAIGQLQSESVDSVEAYFERWIRQARLSRSRMIPRLIEAWESEGAEPTAFAAVNALTRVATHSAEVSPRQRRILGRLAGMLAFRQLHWCSKCMSLLAG